MGTLRFWRRKQILPGVSLNFSKSGPSISLGPRGLHFTVGPRGTRFTAGIPGTGLFYTAPQSWKGTPPENKLSKEIKHFHLDDKTILASKMQEASTPKDKKFLQAMSYWVEGEDVAALEIFSHLTCFADAQFFAGALCFKHLRFEEAEKCFLHVLNEISDFGVMINKYGTSGNLKRNLCPEYINDLHFDEVALNVLLSQTYHFEDKFQESANLLLKYLQEHPSNRIIQLTLISLLYEVQQDDEASLKYILEHTSEATLTDYISAALLLYRARAMRHNKDNENALHILDRLLKFIDGDKQQQLYEATQYEYYLIQKENNPDLIDEIKYRHNTELIVAMLICYEFGYNPYVETEQLQFSASDIMEHYNTHRTFADEVIGVLMKNGIVGPAIESPANIVYHRIKYEKKDLFSKIQHIMDSGETFIEAEDFNTLKRSLAETHDYFDVEKVELQNPQFIDGKTEEEIYAEKERLFLLVSWEERDAVLRQQIRCRGDILFKYILDDEHQREKPLLSVEALSTVPTPTLTPHEAEIMRSAMRFRRKMRGK